MNRDDSASGNIFPNSNTSPAEFLTAHINDSIFENYKTVDFYSREALILAEKSYLLALMFLFRALFISDFRADQTSSLESVVSKILSSHEFSKSTFEKVFEILSSHETHIVQSMKISKKRQKVLSKCKQLISRISKKKRYSHFLALLYPMYFCAWYDKNENVEDYKKSLEEIRGLMRSDMKSVQMLQFEAMMPFLSRASILWRSVCENFVMSFAKNAESSKLIIKFIFEKLSEKNLVDFEDIDKEIDEGDASDEDVPYSPNLIEKDSANVSDDESSLSDSEMAETDTLLAAYFANKFRARRDEKLKKNHSKWVQDKLIKLLPKLSKINFSNCARIILHSLKLQKKNATSNTRILPIIKEISRKTIPVNLKSIDLILFVKIFKYLIENQKLLDLFRHHSLFCLRLAKHYGNCASLSQNTQDILQALRQFFCSVFTSFLCVSRCVDITFLTSILSNYPHLIVFFIDQFQNKSARKLSDFEIEGLCAVFKKACHQLSDSHRETCARVLLLIESSNAESANHVKRSSKAASTIKSTIRLLQNKLQ